MISTMSPHHPIMMSQGWPAPSHSHSSPWNAGILLDVPTIMNQYPPGLTHGAWRASPAPRRAAPQPYLTTALDPGHSTTASTIGAKRPRPAAGVRSTRRAPPPPCPSSPSPAHAHAHARVQPVPVPVAFPADDPFADRHSLQDENSLLLLSAAPPSVTHAHTPAAAHRPARARITACTQAPAPGGGFTYSFQSVDALARQRQRAAADKEARLKVIASILLNRVNVVGKPMRRRMAAEEGRPYVRSALGRCVSVAVE